MFRLPFLLRTLAKLEEMEQKAFRDNKNHPFRVNIFKKGEVMDLIDTRTPVQKEIDRFIMEAKQAGSTLKRTLEKIHNGIWNNKNHSPAELLAALDTKAVELFTIFATAENLVNLLNPGFSAKLQEDRVAYTAHENGSITIDGE